jgi:FG-GAP-like repeat
MAIEFSPAIQLPPSGQTNVLLARDLDGDGNLDLITIDSGNGSSTSLVVQSGTGSGQFAAAQKYVVETVVPNPQYAFYQQRYQTALQNYQNFVNSLPAGVTPQPFTYPETPPSQTQAISIPVSYVSVGDVDRDGRLDLITLGRSSSVENNTIKQTPVVSVLKGTTSGFAAAVNSPVAALSDYPGGLLQQILTEMGTWM